MTDTTIDKRVISSAFPYASNYLQVRGANLHYIDEGAKTAEHTFLLLHGNPTSSYIWRNIIPYLTPHTSWPGDRSGLNWDGEVG